MFYQSPFASQMPAPAVPPAFSEVTQALRIATGTNGFQYLVESKKLCLAVCAAEGMASNLRSQGKSFEPKRVFHQELQNQILAFALMRVLPDDVVKACVEEANETMQAAKDAPAMSAAGYLTRGLENAAGESQEVVQEVQEALVAQPLFRIASQNPELFKKLEESYEFCAPYAAQLLGGLKSSMAMLLTAANNAAGGPAATASPGTSLSASTPAKYDMTLPPTAATPEHPAQPPSAPPTEGAADIGTP